MKNVYEIGIYNTENECEEIVANGIESELEMKDIVNQTKKRNLKKGQYINVIKERIEENGNRVYIGTWDC